jgi:hypothetical protein
VLPGAVSVEYTRDQSRLANADGFEKRTAPVFADNAVMVLPLPT